MAKDGVLDVTGEVLDITGERVPELTTVYGLLIQKDNNIFMLYLSMFSQC